MKSPKYFHPTHLTITICGLPTLNITLFFSRMLFCLTARRYSVPLTKNTSLKLILRSHTRMNVYYVILMHVKAIVYVSTEKEYIRIFVLRNDFLGNNYLWFVTQYHWNICRKFDVTWHLSLLFLSKFLFSKHFSWITNWLRFVWISQVSLKRSLMAMKMFPSTNFSILTHFMLILKCQKTDFFAGNVSLRTSLDPF